MVAAGGGTVTNGDPSSVGCAAGSGTGEAAGGAAGAGGCFPCAGAIPTIRINIARRQTDGFMINLSMTGLRKPDAT
jgi:hypothetical protein